MQDLVRGGLYVMTVHGQEEMESDGLVLGDVERIVLTGSIVERQRDQATAESKYVVAGRCLDDADARIVAKIGPTGRLVIITVYLSTSEDQP